MNFDPQNYPYHTSIWVSPSVCPANKFNPSVTPCSARCINIWLTWEPRNAMLLKHHWQYDALKHATIVGFYENPGENIINGQRVRYEGQMWHSGGLCTAIQ